MQNDVLLGFGFAILTRKTLHELYRCIVDLNVHAQSTEIPPGCIKERRKQTRGNKSQVVSLLHLTGRESGSNFVDQLQRIEEQIKNASGFTLDIQLNLTPQ